MPPIGVAFLVILFSIFCIEIDKLKAFLETTATPSSVLGFHLGNFSIAFLRFDSN